MSTEKTKPAVQLVLGSQAVSFPLALTISKLDGSQACVTFTCKALRKSEWAKAKDQHQQSALRAVTEQSGTRPSDAQELIDYLEDHGVHSVVVNGLQADAQLILRVATGWDLANEFNAESLQQLEDEFGGTFRRLLEAYDGAIFQGRLGN